MGIQPDCLHSSLYYNIICQRQQDKVSPCTKFRPFCRNVPTNGNLPAGAPPFVPIVGDGFPVPTDHDICSKGMVTILRIRRKSYRIQPRSAGTGNPSPTLSVEGMYKKARREFTAGPYVLGYFALSTQARTMASISSMCFNISFARAIWQRVRTRLWSGALILKYRSPSR